MCMANILRTLLRWYHPATGTVTQVVETPAPDEVPLGATVSVEDMVHTKAPEPSEASEVPDVAPETPQVMGEP
jgi:hypothetical protein